MRYPPFELTPEQLEMLKRKAMGERAGLSPDMLDREPADVGGARVQSMPQPQPNQPTPKPVMTPAARPSQAVAQPAAVKAPAKPTAPKPAQAPISGGLTSNPVAIGPDGKKSVDGMALGKILADLSQNKAFLEESNQETSQSIRPGLIKDKDREQTELILNSRPLKSFRDLDESSDRLQRQVDSYSQMPSHVDLTPAFALLDSWKGTNLAKSYKAPVRSDERAEVLAKLQDAVTKQRYGMAQNDLDHMKQLLGAQELVKKVEGFKDGVSSQDPNARAGGTGGSKNMEKLVKMFRADKQVEPLYQIVNSANFALRQLESGSDFAWSGLDPLLARTYGEKGALSDRDSMRFQYSPEVVQKINDIASRWKTGKPSSITMDEKRLLVQVARDSASADFEELAQNWARSQGPAIYSDLTDYDRNLTALTGNRALGPSKKPTGVSQVEAAKKAEPLQKRPKKGDVINGFRFLDRNPITTHKDNWEEAK